MHTAAHRIEPFPAHDDRRRHGRVRCPRVNCRFAGQVQDMSASGLRLRLDRPSPVTPGSSLTLVLGSGVLGSGVLGSGAESVEVKARVVWSRPSGTGHDLGLEFADAGARTRAALFNLAWSSPDAAGPGTSLGFGETCG
jgi:hypothetical protein